MERMPVKIASGAGGTFGVDDLAIAWAWSGGFWHREGLDVEWVPKRGGVMTAQAVLSGEVEVGYGTWVPVMKMRGEGKPVCVLSSMAQALAQNLLVRKDSVTEPSDLRGKKWAVDGIGALSHTLARLIVQGLGIPDTDVEWVVSGPPPQRISALLSGAVDCSLVRVEEATALAREHSDVLCNLLGFDRILSLAPVQPHGVLQITKSFAVEQPEKCRRLVKGLMLASRSLHTDKDAFRQAVKDHVVGGSYRPSSAAPVPVTDVEIDRIWSREVSAGSFAVNGGMTRAHWAKEAAMFRSQHPGVAVPELADLLEERYVDEVVREVGAFAAGHDQVSRL